MQNISRLPLERVGKISPALDLNRYDPQGKFKDMRTLFGIGSKDIVIGMIARFQKYRRTAVFLEAVKKIAKEFPNREGSLGWPIESDGAECHPAHETARR